MLPSLRKKKNNMSDKSYTTQGHLPMKVAPDIGFRDEPVIQCDVPVVKNTFVDDRK